MAPDREQLVFRQNTFNDAIAEEIALMGTVSSCGLGFLRCPVQEREHQEGEDLKVQYYPASSHSRQGMEQGNEDGSHAGYVTRERPKRSRIKRTTGFITGTGNQVRRVILLQLSRAPCT